MSSGALPVALRRRAPFRASTCANRVISGKTIHYGQTRQCRAQGFRERAVKGGCADVSVSRGNSVRNLSLSKNQCRAEFPERAVQGVCADVQLRQHQVAGGDQPAAWGQPRDAAASAFASAKTDASPPVLPRRRSTRSAPRFGGCRTRPYLAVYRSRHQTYRYRHGGERGPHTTYISHTLRPGRQWPILRLGLVAEWNRAK